MSSASASSYSSPTTGPADGTPPKNSPAMTALDANVNEGPPEGPHSDNSSQTNWFPRFDSSLNKYSRNSFSIDDLPELLWKALQAKYPKHVIGPLQPEVTVTVAAGRQQQEVQIPNEIQDAAQRLRRTLPGLVPVLKKAGLRRIMCNMDDVKASIKRGRYSFVVAHGSGIERYDAVDRLHEAFNETAPGYQLTDTHKKNIMKDIPGQDVPGDLLVNKDALAEFIARKHTNERNPVQAFLDSFQQFLDIKNPLKFYHSPKLGELLRISSPDEEQEWAEGLPPPMLLRPLHVLQKKPVNIAMYPEIMTQGIDRRHIAFLDMVSAISGYFFDDFLRFNAGFITVQNPETGRYRLLPIVLDGGAISDHPNELTVLEEFKRKEEGRELFEHSNFYFYDVRRNHAETGIFKYYLKNPRPEGFDVKFSPATGRIDVSIEPRTLQTDFKEWFETLGLNAQQLKDLTFTEKKEYAFVPNGDGHFRFCAPGHEANGHSPNNISRMVEQRFGRMAVVAQAVNEKIHQLYRSHMSFPATWSADERRELEAYKKLRSDITHEIRKVIAPLYEQAQDKYARMFRMTPGQIGGIVTQEILDKRHEEVAKHEAYTVSKIAHQVLPFKKLDFRKKSRVAGWLEKYPDVDPESIGLAMRKVIEEEMATGKRDRQPSDPKWMKHRSPGDSGWMDKVEAELVKLQVSSSHKA
jgi:hypothetical protein